jgi:hypothetical protein
LLALEQVFLLGRLGNVSEALLLFLQRLCDVRAAVDFCLEHQDAHVFVSVRCTFVRFSL